MNISGMISSAKSVAARKCGDIKLWGIRNGPTIGVVVGLVSLGYTVYSACKATLKVENVLSTHCERLAMVKETYSNEEETVAMGLTAKDKRHDIFVTYLQTMIGLGKLYGPAIIAGGIGITSIICAHNTQNRRIQSVAAAYSALQSMFDRYHRVVRARYGEEADFYAINGLVEETGQTVEVQNKDGETEQKTVYGVDQGTVGAGYTVIFDASSGEFERHDEDYNIAYIRARQSEANMLLDMRGHLFLNEVYDLIFGEGERRTLAGQYVGWVKDGDGDGYVDFRIKVMHSEPFDDGKPFEAPPIMIDPNVDGLITDCLVPKRKHIKADFEVDEAIDKWKERAETE